MDRLPGPPDLASLRAEYDAITSGVGLIDRSYLTKIRVVGRDSLDLLQRITTNDLSHLKGGTATWTLFLTEKGRVVDFVTAYLTADSSIMLLSFAPSQVLMVWLGKFIIMEDVRLNDETSAFGLLTMVGPATYKALQAHRVYYRESEHLRPVIEQKMAGVDVIVGPLEHHLLNGINILMPRSDLEILHNALVRTSGPGRPVPSSENTFEVLRVELGIARYGKELTAKYNPLEAGLKDFISFSKGCYVGQEVVARLETYEKLQRKLVGIVTDETSAIPVGAQLKYKGSTVGEVTSSEYSVRLGKKVGLAYVRVAHSSPGTELTLSSNSHSGSSRVSDLPFK